MKTIAFSSPVFADKKVQELNIKLATLGWIQNQYPICWKGEVSEGTFPEVYYNDGSNKNLRVMPEGNSMSFFQINGNITEVEEFHFTIPLKLIVWADLCKVYPNKKYDYTFELVKEVVTILHNSSCNDITIDTTDVFNEFTFLQKMLNQNTMKPYSVFSVTFTCLSNLC